MVSALWVLVVFIMLGIIITSPNNDDSGGYA